MKTKRILITLTESQMNMMTALMAKYGQSRRSALFALLMANDINRKPVGRPTKDEPVDPNDIVEPDFSDDKPKKIYYAGRMIGPREMKYLEEKQDNFPQSI